MVTAQIVKLNNKTAHIFNFVKLNMQNLFATTNPKNPDQDFMVLAATVWFWSLLFRVLVWYFRVKLDKKNSN